MKLRVVELVPNQRVEWECISTHPKNSRASAWTGTHFILEIVEGDNVASADSNRDQIPAYDEESEFFGSNNSAWAQVLQNVKRTVESQRS